MSFKKKDIIKKKNEIKNVIYSGEKIKSHYFDIFYFGNKKIRIAILLNRSIKKAHERNKVKRRIREIIRKNEKIEKNDLIIKIKKNVIKKRYSFLKREIKEMMEKIQRKREESE